MYIKLKLQSITFMYYVLVITRTRYDVYLVEVEPVPDDADEEGESKHSLELDKPGDRRPPLSANDDHNDHHNQGHLGKGGRGLVC